MAGFAQGIATDPRTGQSLGDYVIKQMLGRGGMGVVYLAEHKRLGRNVALKLLAPALAQNDVVRERFVRESRRAAAIDHPNIIPVFEANEIDGHLFIAMRYVAGQNVRQLIQTAGPLAADRAVRVVGQVGSALDAAHRVGLVHRDVKPANVMVDEQGSDGHEHCYLTDFGLTKDISSSTGFTDTGQFIGTIQYVAPEQIEGRTLDARTDVYALGCVLYECLTGQVPFPRENDLAVMFAHINEPPPRPSVVRPEIGEAMDDVVARAMAKSPQDRHQTCAELVAEAREAAAGRRPARSAAAPPPVVAPPAAVAPAAPPESAAATRPEPAPPPVAAPPSHHWSTPPPFGWPAPPEPDDGGPNYLLAAAIVAIAVLLTAGGIAAALLRTSDDGRGAGAKKGSADERAQARRLIEQTTQLNREVIRLQERVVSRQAADREALAQLTQERERARRLAASAQTNLRELRNVRKELIASNDSTQKVTRQLRRFVRTGSRSLLPPITIQIQNSVQHNNEAATDFQDAAGGDPTKVPGPLQVDPATLPEVRLNVPDDANVKVIPPPTASVSGITGAGDVNGDGRDDLLVGYSGDGIDGTAVVFGQAGQTDVDLADLGSNGFEVTGATSYFVGSVEAGDVDGDGKDDVVVQSSDPQTDSREWFVVFGADDPSPVDLSSAGDRATSLTLSGPADGYFTESVAEESAHGVGDVNGDGNDDVAVSSPSSDNGPGKVWVATNVARGSEVSLDSLGGDGFQITGSRRDAAFGGGLSGAGDVNGDGTDDLLVAAPYEGKDRGAAYVIFGSHDPQDVDMSNLGDQGIRLAGGSGTTAGAAVAGIGDVNGDKLADMIVGAPTASPGGLDGAGVAYVVFGRHDPGRVDLTNLGDGGFRIDGPAAKTVEPGGEFTPGVASEVAAAGDVNGDGTPDMVVNATHLQDSALAWIVYGKSTTSSVDLAHPGGEAVALDGAANSYLQFGTGLDFDGDKQAEIPFTVTGQSTSGSATEGHLIGVGG